MTRSTLALRRWKARFEWGTWGSILFDDSTGNLQIAAGIYSVLLGMQLMQTLHRPVIPADAALYGWVPQWAWSVIRIGLGIGQIWVSRWTRERWRSKYRYATGQLVLSGYAVLVYWLTSRTPAAGLLWLTLMEAWIAGRVLYDRDINGSDRRGRSGG